MVLQLGLNCLVSLNFKPMEDKLGVALTKELCRCCAKEVDGPIVMNKTLTKSMAKKVEDMHGQCIGFADEPCDECKGYMSKGVIIVTVDSEKTTDQENPWRTGGFFVVSMDWIKKVFQEGTAKLMDKTRMAFMEHKDAVRLGFFNPQDNEIDRKDG